MLYEIINQYAEPYRPYMRGFINHLPMVQLALYQMTGDIDPVKKYSVYFADNFSVDPLQIDYERAENIDACIGKRDLYESCLDHVSDAIASQGIEQILKHVLSKYPLGMSSGLFHVLIRLGFAVEGYQLEPESTDEIARALAYYLSAYRAARLFNRQVDRTDFSAAMHELIQSPPVKRIVQAPSSLGQTLKALYHSKDYIQAGAFIKGNTSEKVSGLLDYLIPLYNKTHDIVVLHCITGLHAVLMLKVYFKDINHALDILTACITTHIFAIKIRDRFNLAFDPADFSWDALLKKGVESTDVHTIKLVYSCHELYRAYPDDRLKEVAFNKIYSAI